MMKQRITEARFEALLARWLERKLERGGGQVATFLSAGVLTRNRGLVVTLANGQEFQLTLVESTRR